MAFNKIPKTRRSQLSDSVDFAGIPSILPLRDSSYNIAQRADFSKSRDADTEIQTDSVDSGSRIPSTDDQVRMDTKTFEDQILPSSSYTFCEAFWSVVAIVSYVADMGSDIFVAYMFFLDGKLWYFGLTVGFVVASSLTITAVSLTWYRQDSVNYQPSRKQWACRLILHILQLGPVLRYFDTIHYGVRSRKVEKSNSKHLQRDWSSEKVYEETDASLLRLFECYLEAAPQLTLQLYIILVDGFSKTIYFAIGQGVCCVTSLTSITWALTAYNTALRSSLNNRSKMTNASITAMFFWRLFSVTARVFALALFASQFHFYIFIIIGFHYAAMLSWLLSQDANLCSSCLTEVVFMCVLALICTFDFFNVSDGHTRLRYLFFYSLLFVENLTMTLTLFLASPTDMPKYMYSLVPAVVVMPLVAISLQMFYYLIFHPNNSDWKDGKNRIRTCVPWSELRKSCCSRKILEGKL